MENVFTWRIEMEDGSVFTGETERTDRVKIVCTLPEGKIKSVTGECPFPVANDEWVFVNGFQSWSNCPERHPDGHIAGLSHLPRAGVKGFGLERYGDYYFTHYAEAPGIFHGESYGYVRAGGTFRLFASLCELQGYTIFCIDAKAGVLRARRDCGGFVPGGDFAAFDLLFAEGTENEVFDRWFSLLGVVPRTREKIAGYSSWYNRYQNISSDTILSDLDACSGMLQPGDLFQVDDGWEPAVGDWLSSDPNKFPDGMKRVSERIHLRGYRAGLWLAPFVCQRSSRLFREHPDWTIRVKGRPWFCGVNWGGFYSLDIDRPEVREYLKRVFDRVLSEWRFDLVKLDFLYGAAPLGTESETRAGRMTRAMDLLRELCGDSLILGCGVPLVPAFGRVDYCRIGCDVGLDWDGSRLMQLTHRERVSTRQSLENTVFRRELDGRAFGNDPDVFFLRSDNLKLTEQQKEILATFNTLLGSVWLTSDDMSAYTPEAKEHFRALRELREAENVRVTAGTEGVRINYTLNGQEMTAAADLSGDRAMRLRPRGRRR